MTTFEKALKFILQNQRSKADARKPLLVAMQGVQGCGKSHLTKLLIQTINEPKYNLKAVGLSIDDFYITHADQVELSKMGNALLERRGLPGTHDIQLLKSVIEALLEGKSSVLIPQFDKSLHKGQGDRKQYFLEIIWPVDIIILEGWFLGFKSIEPDILTSLYHTEESFDNVKKYSLENIMQINTNLRVYESDIYIFFDCFIQLVAENLNYVFEWRLEQEETLKKSLMKCLPGDCDNDRTGMTHSEVENFVRKFMPVYELYLDRLTNDLVGSKLRIFIDQSRRLIQSSST